MYKILLFFLLCIYATSCSRYYVSVSRQSIDRRYLASTHVGTPDPRQEHPPLGQMLIIDWQVPQSIYKKHSRIVLDVIYWNNTEKRFSFPIQDKVGYVTYSLLNREFAEKKGILTYRAKIAYSLPPPSIDGKMVSEGPPEEHVYREWKHQLWVRLIQVGDPAEQGAPSAESAQETNVSVEDQSIHASVMEIPEAISPDSN